MPAARKRRAWRQMGLFVASLRLPPLRTLSTLDAVSLAGGRAYTGCVKGCMCGGGANGTDDDVPVGQCSMGRNESRRRSAVAQYGGILGCVREPHRQQQRLPRMVWRSHTRSGTRRRQRGGGDNDDDDGRGGVGQNGCIVLITRSAIWARRGQTRTTTLSIMFHGGHRLGERGLATEVRAWGSSALDEVGRALVTRCPTREGRWSAERSGTRRRQRRRRR